MAKTKKKEFQIRRVRSKEDRKRPTVFMRLKAEEMFKGVALFEPDPEAKDNPGYFEYYDHWDEQGRQYVPCAGDKCPFCAANDNPSTRALTVWYMPDNDAKDQIKVFTMNFGTINDIADESEEEDGILGRKLRIKRMNDKGDYKVKVLSGKKLTKTELKAVMDRLEELVPGGLEALVERQLKAQMERLKALDALEDDDDDDDDVTDEADDDDDDDEDDEDAEEEDDEDDEDETEDDDKEESEDEEDEDDEDDEESESEDEPETDITNSTFTVEKVDEEDEVLDLKGDDGKVKMWVGQGVDPDYDELVKGATIVLSAQQDDEGDYVITALEVQKKKEKSKTKGKTKTGGKSAGKGRGKGKGKK